MVLTVYVNDEQVCPNSANARHFFFPFIEIKIHKNTEILLLCCRAISFPFLIFVNLIIEPSNQANIKSNENINPNNLLFLFSFFWLCFYCCFEFKCGKFSWTAHSLHISKVKGPCFSCFDDVALQSVGFCALFKPQQFCIFICTYYGLTTIMMMHYGLCDIIWNECKFFMSCRESELL